jgi:O-antigen/teichoic acid export membrane protein
MSSIDKKRIAKNTILLYVRMALNMAVSLYTSRVLLRVLGIEDYGLYNVIGGVVILFSFLNNSMGGATSRFITFALGKGDSKELNRIFSASLLNHIFIAIMIFILAETIGLYLVFQKLVIPTERFNSALYVYQFSIFTAMLTMTQIPYNACIIAHEKMSAFAYLSIGETLLKLGAVIVLQFVYGYDRLTIYAVLIFIITIFITLSYRLYCKKSFEECTYHFFMDSVLYKKLFVYAGWDLIGGFSGIAQGQGLNILLNMFFGPVVNAARAVSVQVQTALSQFSSNFMMAVRPQVIKAYAEGKVSEMLNLVYLSTRYGSALTLFFALPVFIEIEYILRLWLGTVPKYADSFCRVLILVILVNVMRNPFVAAFHAVGHIRLGNVVCGSLLISTLPIAYIALKHGASPLSVFWITLVITGVAQWVDLLNLKRFLPISFSQYLKLVYAPVWSLVLISGSLVYCFQCTMEPSFLRLIGVTIVSFVVIACYSYVFILTRDVRNRLKYKLKGYFANVQNNLR